VAEVEVLAWVLHPDRNNARIDQSRIREKVFFIMAPFVSIIFDNGSWRKIIAPDKDNSIR
jgi:hypothetical protein